MTSKKLNSMPPHVDGSHCMSWRELVEADDIATSLIVDPFLGFKTHKMTEMRLRINDKVKRYLKNIIIDFQKHKDYEKAYAHLLGSDVQLKRSLKGDDRFRLHIYRYLLLFDERSGVQIRPCWRYASESHMGAAIFATRDWPKGSRIESLVGCIAELKYEEEVSFLRHKENDFSVMYSSRKNRSQLWLGPAAYVNHDCQPNCAFTINCDGDARMSLNVLQDIKNGEEVYIYYGKHFFDPNNVSCECFTCELLGRGFFGPSASTGNSSATSTATNGNLFTTAVDQVDGEAPTQHRPSQHADEAVVELLRERLMNGLPHGRTANANAFSPSLSKFSSGIDSRSEDPYKPSEISPSATPTEVNMNGFLTKGLSTGLGCKALNAGQYTLRHTGSRMRRVKAKIFSEVLSQARRKLSAPMTRSVSSPTPMAASSLTGWADSATKGAVPQKRPANTSPPSKKCRPDPTRLTTTTRYSLRVRTPPKSTGVASKLPLASQAPRKLQQRTRSSVRGVVNRRNTVAAWSSSSKRVKELLPRPTTEIFVDLTELAEETPDVVDDLCVWRQSLNHRHSPAASSTSSTIAATCSDPHNLPSPLFSPAYSLRSRLSCNATAVPPTARQTREAPMSCHSCCSSASTCPATASFTDSAALTPRLRLIYKRSRTESPLESEAMTEDEDEEEEDCGGEWYVEDDPPPPLRLSASSSSSSFIARYEASLPPMPLSFLQQRKRFGGGTSVSNTSVSNTPSPPQLQASGSPPPPILHQPEDPFLHACRLPETAPALGQVEEDEEGDGGNIVVDGALSAEECLKPLTMKIRRLGSELYCVPSETSDSEDKFCEC